MEIGKLVPESEQVQQQPSRTASRSLVECQACVQCLH